MLPPGYSRVPSKIVRRFGPALWPAIDNIYMNNIYKQIYIYERRALLYRFKEKISNVMKTEYLDEIIYNVLRFTFVNIWQTVSLFPLIQLIQIKLFQLAVDLL